MTDIYSIEQAEEVKAKVIGKIKRHVESSGQSVNYVHELCNIDGHYKIVFGAGANWLDDAHPHYQVEVLFDAKKEQIKGAMSITFDDLMAA